MYEHIYIVRVVNAIAFEMIFFDLQEPLSVDGFWYFFLRNPMFYRVFPFP